MLIVYAEERPSEGRHLTKCKEHGVVDLPSRDDKECRPDECDARECEEDGYPKLDSKALAHNIELVVGVDVDARGCYFDGVDSLPVHLELLANASSPVQWLVVKEHI